MITGKRKRTSKKTSEYQKKWRKIRKTREITFSQMQLSIKYVNQYQKDVSDNFMLTEYLEEIPVEEKTHWNSVVRSFPNYDVFYLNEYVTAFMREDEKNGIPLLLYYHNRSDRAINVVFKRDIACEKKLKGKLKKGEYFDLISPYGYGGFLGTILDFDSLNQIYNEYCRESGYICEFVRFELFSDYFQHYDGEVETRTHNVVRNLQLPLEEIWMDFKQKVRKNVKKAESYHLEIRMENTDEHLQDFLDIYFSTMDRNHAESEYYFSEEFYQNLNHMKENIMYFYVLHDEEVISCELVIYGAENAYSYLGGTNREYFDLRPNDFLKYEIIKWAKKKGMKNFVLGGGYGEDDGIFRYKACLAPKGIVDFYIGRKIFDSESYEKLVKIREKENPDCMRPGFFPAYRA